MRKFYYLTFLLFFLSGCYHAQITTGLEPSSSINDTYEVKWAHGFLYGLVPPNLVKAEQECDNGVAKVETKHSFLNQVANALTFGIYTPIHITITCAES